jgi:predicted metal-dependent hydrolase
MRPAPEDRPKPCDSPQAADLPPVSPREEGALEAAVKATLEAADVAERVTAEEIDALQAIARRYGPVPLTLAPIAIDLVAAIINVNYGGLNRAPEVWQTMATKIATVLYESPAAQQRLENLWRQLLESDECNA